MFTAKGRAKKAVHLFHDREDAMPMMKKLTGIATIISLMTLALPWASSRPAQAQGWPTRTVKFIVPLGGGSGVDFGARLFAERLAKKWGQPVVVENMPGGDGVIAINAVLTGKDNHVLLMSPASQFTHHPYTHDKMPYNLADLIPVARISNTIVSYSVPGTSDINTVADLVARAKAQPGKINTASATPMLDYVLRAYLKSAGAEVTPVPYRNTVQAATDLAEDRIQFMIAAIAIVRPLVQSGKVKMIAVTNKVRAPVAPNVPTTTEAGFPQLATDGLVGLFSTADLSAEQRTRIAADVKEVAGDAEIGKRLEGTGQILNAGSGPEFDAAIKEQLAQMAAAAKVLGLKAAQ
jgi:tripartite-type tricarboxylate transporter receptor subunit TctC